MDRGCEFGGGVEGEGVSGGEGMREEGDAWEMNEGGD